MCDEKQSEIERIEKLAYFGEHHFPDLTFKVRCSEQHSTIERLTTELADARELIDKLHGEAAAEIKRLRDELREQIERAKHAEDEATTLAGAIAIFAVERLEAKIAIRKEKP